ncbi:MAG: hypothetical protein GWO40_14480 [Gammaproteobacteria bacterium]|nr:hypothetical protein [Gammaproteobacteria bacterium]NIX86742.1 hypothetical protein [Gammaproteobacteria bacterium]
MEFAHDVHDWLGGYPYRSITPKEVFEMMDGLGFKEVRSFLSRGALGLFGTGCEEFVFRRVR